MDLARDELRALVVLNRLGQDRRPYLTLLGEGLRPSEILERVRAENFSGRREQLAALLSRWDPGREMEQCGRLGIRLLSILDPDYPLPLKQTADPPILLYQRGGFLEADDAAVAIVGSRHPSFYGTEQAKRFAAALAGEGLTIVSGFAAGIDRTAHEAALTVPYGRTIAVMGCGLDLDYPRGSRGLADAIAERGVLLSEYALGTVPLAENFPRRNRIIAGLAMGVLVVQAHSRSGSLITAHEAADQGREVFALPGSVEHLQSRGTHALIREGALLVESPEDILDSLFLPLQRVVSRPRPGVEGEIRRTQSLSDQAQAVIEALSERALTFDEIALKCDLEAGPAASLLMGLELNRRVRKEPSGRFVRV